MAEEAMITQIKNGIVSDELIEAIVEWEWDNDPFGILNEYEGGPEDEDVHRRMRDDVVYVLTTDPQAVIDYITG